MVNLTSFALLTAFVSHSHFFLFIESHENVIIEFIFCYLSKWELKKIYLWYPFTALQVNRTMMTSDAEEHRNVKKVHKNIIIKPKHCAT